MLKIFHNVFFTIGLALLFCDIFLGIEGLSLYMCLAFLIRTILSYLSYKKEGNLRSAKIELNLSYLWLFVTVLNIIYVLFG